MSTPTKKTPRKSAVEKAEKPKDAQKVDITELNLIVGNGMHFDDDHIFTYFKQCVPNTKVRMDEKKYEQVLSSDCFEEIAEYFSKYGFDVFFHKCYVYLFVKHTSEKLRNAYRAAHAVPLRLDPMNIVQATNLQRVSYLIPLDNSYLYSSTNKSKEEHIRKLKDITERHMPLFRLYNLLCADNEHVRSKPKTSEKKTEEIVDMRYIEQQEPSDSMEA